MSSDGYGRIFGYTLISYSPTGTDVDADYPFSNLQEYDYLDLPYRSNTTGAKTITLTFSGTVKALIIDHCNFTSITVNSTSYTMSRDPRTWRYRLVLIRDLTSPITITIPNQATTDGASYHSIARIVLTSAYVEMTLNENSNSVSAPYPEPIVNHLAGGGFEDVETGDLKRFEKKFRWERNSTTNVNDEHWALDHVKPTDYIIYFDNEGSSSQGYLCKKKYSLEITQEGSDNPEILGISEHYIVEV